MFLKGEMEVSGFVGIEELVIILVNGEEMIELFVSLLVLKVFVSEILIDVGEVNWLMLEIEGIIVNFFVFINLFIFIFFFEDVLLLM